MEKLKVKNFGSISEGFSSSEDGYFEINNVSIFIGDQGTGKSTVAKLYSTFAWLEKALIQHKYENDLSIKEFKDLCANQRIPESYFTDTTELGYKGNAYKFELKNNIFKIASNLTNSKYICPKIMYVPSERNLLSVLERAEQIKQLPQMIKEFSAELRNAHLWVKKYSSSSFLGYKIIYNENDDLDYIQPDDLDYTTGEDSDFPVKDVEKSIPITKASSGLQSAVPLILVTDYLSEELENDILKKIKSLDISTQNFVLEKITDPELKGKVKLYITSNIDKNFSSDEKNELKKSLSKYVNSRFINIVEEPEQNLFPSSQVKIFNSLLIHKKQKNDKVIITTHSPYILSAINNCIYAKEMYLKTKKTINEIPKKLFIDINDVSAYMLQDGKIKDIKDNEYNLIDASAIDDCSSQINSVYSALMDLDNENEAN